MLSVPRVGCKIDHSDFSVYFINLIHVKNLVHGWILKDTIKSYVYFINKSQRFT